MNHEALANFVVGFMAGFVAISVLATCVLVAYVRWRHRAARVGDQEPDQEPDQYTLGVRHPRFNPSGIPSVKPQKITKV